MGGTGFLGRPVCDALAQLDYEVVVVSRHARQVPPTTKLVPADLSVSASVDVVRDVDPDVIVNAAGGTWGLADSELYAANVGITENVLAAAAALPRRARLVHIGSVHEYGLVPVGESMDEDMEPAPITLYGQLKARCAEAVVGAARAGTVDGIVLRVGNVTGAGQPAASLLGDVAARLHRAHVEGRPAVLDLGPLNAQRDFLNRSDAVAAIVAAVTVSEVAEPLVNIGHGQPTSARTMVEMLIAASGVPADLRERPAEAPDPLWQHMRIERARSVLGWAPGPDLSEGVRELWDSLVAGAPEQPPAW